MRERCGIHGLALGDDGKCVLCRRPSVSPTEPSAVRAGVSRIPAAILFVGAAGATAYLVSRPAAPVPLAVAAVAEPGAASEGAIGESTSGLAPAGERKPRPPSRWVSAPTVDTEAERRAASERAARERALKRQQAEFEAWAHREATRQMAEDEARARGGRGDTTPTMGATTSVRADAPHGRSLAELAASTPITMYSTSWCGVCKRARAFLQSAQVPFTERDVEQDQMAAQEARRLNPSGSVPTFDVGGRALVGFDPRSLTAALESAAARR